MRKISVRGVKDTKRRRLVRLATNHILDQLVSPRMELDITILFSNLLETNGSWGECDNIDDSAREFQIHIDQTQPIREQLRTLAHELVHVRQFARKELYDLARKPNLSRWRNTLVDNVNTKYRKLPWEKEAYGLQTQLLNAFLKEHKINLKEYENVQVQSIQSDSGFDGIDWSEVSAWTYQAACEGDGGSGG